MFFALEVVGLGGWGWGKEIRNSILQKFSKTFELSGAPGK